MIVTITLTDGEGKEAEIEFRESDRAMKLIVIENIFRLIGLENEIFTVFENYNKLRNRYPEIFQEVEQEPIDINKLRAAEISNEVVRELAAGLSTYEKPQIFDGVKIAASGARLYQTYYQCTNLKCSRKSKCFIPLKTKVTPCRYCGTELEVFPATDDSRTRDKFGNYFRAGNYKENTSI